MIKSKYAIMVLGATALSLLFFSCKFGQDPEEGIEVNIHNPDPLPQDADSIKVSVLYNGGNTPRLLYTGKKDAPGFDGPYEGVLEDYKSGNITLVIEAFNSSGAALPPKSYEYMLGGGKLVGVPSITILTDTLRLKAGEDPQDIPFTLFPKSSTQIPFWESENPQIAQVASSNRVSPLAPGTTHIIVKPGADAPPDDTLYIVVEPAAPPANLEKVVILNDSLVIYIGSTPVTLSAVINPPEKNNGLIWSIRNPAVAQITSEGQVTPREKGRTYALAMSKDNISAKDSIPIIVLTPDGTAPLDSVRINAGSVNLAEGGEPLSLTYTLYPTNSQASVFWYSSNTQVVNIDKTGTITGLQTGDAVITLTAVANNAVSHFIPATVSPAIGKLVVTAEDGSVTVEPFLPQYDWGDTITLTPVPNADHGFSSWSGDANGKDNPLTLIMYGSKSIQANFAPLSALTCNDISPGSNINTALKALIQTSGKGTLCPAPGLYNSGAIKIVGKVQFTIL